MPRVPDSVLVASIAAISAIGGTLIGGVITYKTNEALQNRQTRQEEARQATAAQAVARLLMSEYEDDADQLRYMIATHEFAPESYRERTFVSRIDLEDRKLMAGRLSEKVWSDISEATREVELVEADMEIHRGVGVVGEDEHETFERARAACETATEALTPLATSRHAT